MLSVIIVEDSSLVRDRLRELIADIPLLSIVGEYDNAPAAISALRQRGVDIVLLDLKLNGSDGLDVLRNAGATLPSTTFIVFTNHTDKVYRRLSTQYGADHFFSKAHETEQLRETLIALTKISAGSNDPT